MAHITRVGDDDHAFFDAECQSVSTTRMAVLQHLGIELVAMSIHGVRLLLST
jgi:hypothetical protein